MMMNECEILILEYYISKKSYISEGICLNYTKTL